jgi:hypothetical protein
MTMHVAKTWQNTPILPFCQTPKEQWQWQNDNQSHQNSMSFIIHRNSETGLSEPRFQCDRCVRLIHEARHAILVWDNDQEDKNGDISPRMVCKGTCDSQELPMSMELSRATFLLAKHYRIKLGAT